MNKKEALEFISSVNWMGSRLGLERMRELMHLLNDPQDQLQFIHVAGTNGKGSASMMISSILINSGYKTALYTSPHLSSYNERFIINNEMISDERFAQIADEVRAACLKMEDHPTEFEAVTAMAFLYFAQEKCDYVVLEVGLGGRLDATNVIKKPIVSVIMNIGLEHTQILGDTLEKIACEKAGIIKEGVPCVVYPSEEEALEVFRKVCKDRGSKLIIADKDQIKAVYHDLDSQVFNYKDRSDIRIKLLGDHQLVNTSVVLETMNLLKELGLDIKETDIREGLANAFWPARMEVLSKDPLFILDGAHNLQCATALSMSLKNILKEKAVFLMGVLADKDYSAIVDMMIPYGRCFVCVTPDSPRALSNTDLRDHLISKGAKAIAVSGIGEGLETVLNISNGSPIVAFGSLYMAGAIREKFKNSYHSFLRNEMRQQRAALSTEQIAKSSKIITDRIRALDEYQDARTVMIYNAIGGEVDLSYLETDDKIFVYPKVIGELKAFKADKGTTEGAFGIKEPNAENQEIAIEDIDLIICPMVAFDDNNQRLGMGKGYYDRFLKDYKGNKIGVAYGFQGCRNLFSDTHDVAMDKIVTDF